MNFLNFINLLWLPKRMTLFLGNAQKVFRGKGALCLQVTLRWFRKKKKKNVFIQAWSYKANVKKKGEQSQSRRTRKNSLLNSCDSSLSLKLLF